MKSLPSQESRQEASSKASSKQLIDLAFFLKKKNKLLCDKNITIRKTKWQCQHYKNKCCIHRTPKKQRKKSRYPTETVKGKNTK